MKSDDKPQLLFRAKYLWKAPHTHFQRKEKKIIILWLCCASISRTQQKPLTLFAENNKNTGLCQIDGKFDGFLWAVLTTPFDSLLYMRKNQSSAANSLVKADNYLHKGGGLMVTVSLVCHKGWIDWTNVLQFFSSFFLGRAERKEKKKKVQIINGMYNTTSNFLYHTSSSSEEFKAPKAITNVQ